MFYQVKNLSIHQRNSTPTGFEHKEGSDALFHCRLIRKIFNYLIILLTFHKFYYFLFIINLNAKVCQIIYTVVYINLLKLVITRHNHWLYSKHEIIKWYWQLFKIINSNQHICWRSHWKLVRLIYIVDISINKLNIVYFIITKTKYLFLNQNKKYLFNDFI